MKAIGIGCFWFAAPGGAPENYPDEDSDFSPAEHIEKIRRSLEGVDNITNIAINRSGNSYFVAGESFSGDEEEENFFPLIGRMEIEFAILIPERVQRKYLFGRDCDKGVSNFHVRIVYDTGLPVTYVHYDVPAGKEQCHTYSPSSAVIVVREYLREKLKENTEVEFQVLGPSPFHADFFLVTAEGHEPESIESDLSVPSGGYSTLYFELPVKSDEVLSAFIATQQPTLSAFYRVIRYKNLSLRLGNKIANGAQLLIESSMSGGINSIRRWLGHGPIIDDVYSSILNQKMNNIALNSFIFSCKANDEIDQDGLIYEFMAQETSDPFAVPIDDVKDILKLLEDRRQGYIRNTTTVASGLIGGILGATLTFLLGSHSAGNASVPNHISINPALQQSAPQKP